MILWVDIVEFCLVEYGMFDCCCCGDQPLMMFVITVANGGEDWVVVLVELVDGVVGVRSREEGLDWCCWRWRDLCALDGVVGGFLDVVVL